MANILRAVKKNPKTVSDIALGRLLVVVSFEFAEIYRPYHKKQTTHQNQ